MGMVKDKKGGQSSVYDSDERAKGFTQKGIPEKDGLRSIEGGAVESTSAEKSSNVQKEDRGG